MSRGDLVFASGAERCAAWHYRPESSGPAPCVVLAHGFDGVREQRLDAYAERFARAGMAALVFDYRGFGASTGTPRQLVSNSAQLDDWRAAIECARGLEGVDPARVALWGTSTSAGHVIRLAARDGEVAAVVAQVPLADGLAQLLATPPGHTLRLLWAGLQDRLGTLLGRPPKLIAAAGRPGALAAVTSPDALSGLDAITPPRSDWRNEVVARFALGAAAYRPVRDAGRVRCPLLVCVADGDRVIPAAPALRLARDAARAQLRRYPFGHFAVYAGDGFERVVRDQVAFLQASLGVDTRVRELAA